MSYKIKNKTTTVIMLNAMVFIACLGMVVVGSNTPEQYPSTEKWLFGLATFLLGMIGFTALLRNMSWEELKVTDADKQLEDEVNRRVREKVLKITNELSKSE